MSLFSAYLGYETLFIFFLSFASIFSSISIIISKNPIYSVLFLIGLFVGVALYLISIGLVFIGIAYLLVYVGAISILFLFILMLINVRTSELVTEGKNSVILALLVIFSFNYSVDERLPYNDTVSNINFKSIYTRFHNLISGTSTYAKNLTSDLGKIMLIYTAYTLALIKCNPWDASLIGSIHIAAIGNIFYAALYIFLIITSLILLLAMIGSIIITLNKPKTSNFSFSDDFMIQVKSIMSRLNYQNNHMPLQSVLGFNTVDSVNKIFISFSNIKNILNIFYAWTLKWGISSAPKPHNFAYNNLLSMVTPGSSEPNPAGAFKDVSEIHKWSDVSPDRDHIVRDVENMSKQDKQDYIEAVRTEGYNKCDEVYAADLANRLRARCADHQQQHEQNLEDLHRSMEFQKDSVSYMITDIENEIIYSDSESDEENLESDDKMSITEDSGSSSKKPTENSGNSSKEATKDSGDSSKKPTEDIEEAFNDMELTSSLDLSNLNISLLSDINMLESLEYLPYLRYLILVYMIYKSIKH